MGADAAAGYGLLFVTAFGAASILPLSSEPLLIGMVALQGYNIATLWLVASSGNTAGAVLNWGLARWTLHWRNRRWFPLKQEQLGQASRWFRQYGVWTLLLAWVPIIGDALTFVAGLMRVPLPLFLLLVGVGKAARYAVLIWSVDAVLR